MGHVFLVAVEMAEDFTTREAAEESLRHHLPATGGHITCWWVAEDDRRDGSDNDSAVFVTPGNQNVASDLLHDYGLTPEWNITDRPAGQFEGGVSP